MEEVDGAGLSAPAPPPNIYKVVTVARGSEGTDGGRVEGGEGNVKVGGR